MRAQPGSIVVLSKRYPWHCESPSPALNHDPRNFEIPRESEFSNFGIIVAGIANAAYSRANVSAEKRRPFFLYVDEFHHFTTQAFASMLPELRKYGVGLIAANQHTTQLEKPILEAMLGNAGTLMAFRVGATDAEIISRQLGGTIPTPRDLVSLANYEMFVRMMVGGRQSRVFSGRTIPEIRPPVEEK